MANGVAQAFDIFSFSEKFEKVGFPKDQIRVIIEAISASRSHPEAVSHAELREHKAEVKTESVRVEANVKESESKVLHAIAAMETRSDAKFDVLRAEMSAIKSEFATMRWVLGAIATGVISLLIKGFLKL